MSWVLSVDFGTSVSAGACGRLGVGGWVREVVPLARIPSDVCWDVVEGRWLLGDVAVNQGHVTPGLYESCPKRRVTSGQEAFELGGDGRSVRVRVVDVVGAVLGEVGDRGGRDCPSESTPHPPIAFAMGPSLSPLRAEREF